MIEKLIEHGWTIRDMFGYAEIWTKGNWVVLYIPDRNRIVYRCVWRVHEKEMRMVQQSDRRGYWCHH